MEQNAKFINLKKSLSNIAKVATSNVFILLAGILTGFVIPKIMGISDYGYYKTFTLYISYSSLFRFGIVDGIYLIFGGKKYEELKKEKFRFYSKFLCVLEFFVSFIFIIISVLMLDGEYKYVFLFVSVYIWSFNITSYYQIISQITGRFNELSFRNMLQAILSSLGVIGFWGLYKIGNFELTYKIYTCFYVAVQITLTLWYIYTYRDITFGKTLKGKSEFSDIIKFTKEGFPLLFANLCSTLLLALDRQFVNVLFDNSTYAVYAFAYNLLSLVTVATSAVSTVIYPMLKRTEENILKIIYTSLVTIMLEFVFIALIIYYPLAIFIQYFLPKYIEALEIFKVIFPGLAISSVITVIMHNYYKALGKNFEYFVKSLVILVISILANSIAYVLFKSTIAISCASIIVMLLWYIVMESLFIKKYKIKWKKNYIFMILMMIVFYINTFVIQNAIIGVIIYIILLVLMSIIFYKKDFKILYQLLKEGKINE